MRNATPFCAIASYTPPAWMVALIVTAGVIAVSCTMTTAPLSSTVRTGVRPRTVAIVMPHAPPDGTSPRSAAVGASRRRATSDTCSAVTASTFAWTSGR